jgi:hypothetical protein
VKILQILQWIGVLVRQQTPALAAALGGCGTLMWVSKGVWFYNLKDTVRSKGIRSIDEQSQPRKHRLQNS